MLDLTIFKDPSSSDVLMFQKMPKAWKLCHFVWKKQWKPLIACYEIGSLRLLRSFKELPHLLG